MREDAQVSIHVPARGTTTDKLDAFGNKAFQSTFPRGERHNLSFNEFIKSKFQSTFPRGERHKGDGDRSGTRSFNPRSREGNDGVRDCVGAYCRRFQSTFPRGERPHSGRPQYLSKSVSIHVPARGTTIEITTGIHHL